MVELVYHFFEVNLFQVLDKQLVISTLKTGGKATQSKSSQSQSLIVTVITLLQLLEHIIEDLLLLKNVIRSLLFPCEQGDQFQHDIDNLIVLKI